MSINIYLAMGDDGTVIGAFRTPEGALNRLKERALMMMDETWTEEEKEEVLAELEESDGADGFGYIEDAGELYD